MKIKTCTFSKFSVIQGRGFDSVQPDGTTWTFFNRKAYIAKSNKKNPRETSWTTFAREVKASSNKIKTKAKNIKKNIKREKRIELVLEGSSKSSKTQKILNRENISSAKLKKHASKKDEVKLK